MNSLLFSVLEFEDLGLFDFQAPSTNFEQQQILQIYLVHNLYVCCQLVVMQALLLGISSAHKNTPIICFLGYCLAACSYFSCCNVCYGVFHLVEGGSRWGWYGMFVLSFHATACFMFYIMLCHSRDVNMSTFSAILHRIDIINFLQISDSSNFKTKLY